jgi:hypothetical protein
MVNVLVRNKNSLNVFHFQPKAMHTYFGFAARYTCIYEHSIGMGAYVIAVAITTRIDGGYKYRHAANIAVARVIK